jgi:hypothetical protein
MPADLWVLPAQVASAIGNFKFNSNNLDYAETFLALTGNYMLALQI